MDLENTLGEVKADTGNGMAWMTPVGWCVDELNLSTVMPGRGHPPHHARAEVGARCAWLRAAPLLPSPPLRAASLLSSGRDGKAGASTELESCPGDECHLYFARRVTFLTGSDTGLVARSSQEQVILLGSSLMSAERSE